MASSASGGCAASLLESVRMPDCTVNAVIPVTGSPRLACRRRELVPDLGLELEHGDPRAQQIDAGAGRRMPARKTTSATHGGRDAVARARGDDWRLRIPGKEEERSGAHMG